MQKFYDDSDFLLKNPVSKHIYENFAQGLPIVDYHCHLKPDEIYKNKRFEDISEIWLGKDHYKWRLMRANGIEEERITGNATPKDKFMAWAETIERCPGNPLYHWTRMELQLFFDIKIPLNRKTAATIWEETSSRLGAKGLGARDFIAQSNVSVIGTTDDPLSDLYYHQQIKADATIDTQVIPTFRLDKLLTLESEELFAEIFDKFQQECLTLTDYLTFIKERMNYFVANGCRSVDLGVEQVLWKPISTDPAKTFEALRRNEATSPEEIQDLKTHILLEIIELVYDLNWVFQLHFGAVGSVNQEALQRLGRGTGFDTIADQGNIANGLLYLLNQANNRHKLPRTILYNIDGTKNVVTETIAACFQDNEEGIKGKMQHGPAWWFQDTLRGNYRQLEDMAEQGILMNFIGMTTDSRSFLSYARHDYFRRILCNCLGSCIMDGEMPYDEAFVQDFIEAVCFKNAQKYFGIENR